MDNPLHKHGRFFDLWSRFYRLGPLGRELKRVQRQALERLRVVPGQRVLDLGCGPADGVSWLLERGVQAQGLDYSQGMLSSAAREPALRGRLVRGDAGRLPFREAAFDKLVCTNSFHHYPDGPAALREMRRVLKPGGLLVLVDPRADHPFGRLAIDVVENVVFGLKEVHIHTAEAWHGMLRQAGFCDVRLAGGSALHPVALAEVFIEATA